MHAAGFAAFLFDLVSTPENKASAAAGFRGRQAGLNELLDLPIEMKAQFVLKLFLDSVPSKQGAQADQEIIEHVPLPES